MKVINKYDTKIKFQGEKDEGLTVGYDNRGEPYREGVTFDFEDNSKFVAVFLKKSEVENLRDLLCDLYPKQ